MSFPIAPIHHTPIEFSLLTLTINHLDYIKSLLTSILRTAADSRWEWIVGDGGNDSTSTYLLGQSDPRICVLPVNNAAGFSANNNYLARRAAGDILVFINNDVQLTSNWPAAVREDFRDISIDIVGALLRNHDGSVQSFGMGVSPHEDRLTFDHLGEEPFSARRRNIVHMATGALLFIRRSRFESLGGFDEGFQGGYYEDSDFCLRTLAFGGRTIVDSHVEAIHLKSGSLDVTDSYWRFLTANRRRFSARWFRCIRQLADVRPIPYGRLCPGRHAVGLDRWLSTMGGGEREFMQAVRVLARHCDGVTVRHGGQESSMEIIGMLRQRFSLAWPENVRCVSGTDAHSAADIVWDQNYYELPPTPPNGQLYFKRVCAVPPTAGAVSDQVLLLANSDFTREALTNIGTSLTLYPPIVPIIQFSEARAVCVAKEALILNVARFAEQTEYLTWKNHQDLVVNFLRRRNRELRLALAGGVCCQETVEDCLVHARRSGGRLAVTPNIPHPELCELYRKARYFVSLAGFGGPTMAAHEHFGMAVVEAMSAGCIPIAFSGGGHREIIEHGLSGFLVDTPKDCFDIIESLEKEPPLFREQIALAAIQRSLQFGVGLFVSSLESLLYTRLQSPQASAAS